MTLQATDIVFVLSGGSNNTDPNKSLGGDPSSTPILGSLNNLFSDLTTQDAQNGIVDYRCFYIFNNSMTDPLSSADLWIDSEVVGGATVKIGVNFVNEVQTVTINGPFPGSGDFTLSYNGTNFTVAQNNDPNVWAQNFQAAITAIPHLSGVTVTGLLQSNAIVFSVTFAGDAGNRSHPLLELVSQTLGSGNSFDFAKAIQGSPINLITISIDVPTTTPAGIVFSNPTAQGPFFLGDLRPLDGFPVWVQRTLTAGPPFSSSTDGFVLKLQGRASP